MYYNYTILKNDKEIITFNNQITDIKVLIWFSRNTYNSMKYEIDNKEYEIIKTVNF